MRFNDMERGRRDAPRAMGAARSWRRAAAFLASAAMAGLTCAAQVQVGAGDIGGTVTGASGPEAGVWVIAETRDLQTKFSKVVVTDSDGHYVRIRWRIDWRGRGGCSGLVTGERPRFSDKCVSIQTHQEGYDLVPRRWDL